MIIHDTTFFKEKQNTTVTRSHLVPSTTLEWERTEGVQTYKINSYGFRCHYNFDELLGRQVNLCIGDSFTMNEGGAYEDSWPYLIDQQLSIPTLNLGIPSAGNDFIELMFTRAKKLFDVQNVYVMFPTINRYYKRSIIPPFLIHLKRSHNKRNDKKMYANFEKSFDTFNNSGINFKFTFPFNVYFKDHYWEFLEQYRTLSHYVDYGVVLPITCEELIKNCPTKWTNDDGLHFSREVNKNVAKEFLK